MGLIAVLRPFRTNSLCTSPLVMLLEEELYGAGVVSLLMAHRTQGGTNPSSSGWRCDRCSSYPIGVNYDAWETSNRFHGFRRCSSSQPHDLTVYCLQKDLTTRALAGNPLSKTFALLAKPHTNVEENPAPRLHNIGALIIRIGSWGVISDIYSILNPQTLF